MHLCQSNKKCVNIVYTDGCCANCVKSLGKSIEKIVIVIVKNCQFIKSVSKDIYNITKDFYFK